METGVDWCELTVSDELLALVDAVRDEESRLSEALAACGADALARPIVADGVDAACELARDTRLTAEEFQDRCLALRGMPWGQAKARRDVRERVRLLRRVERCGTEVPQTPEGLLELWSEANHGEMAMYEESDAARFRTKGTPFAHGAVPLEYAPPPAGYETVVAERISQEARALLAYVRREDLPPEIRAAATHFLHGYIHPFRDGNGHTARMLACAMLSGGYSTPTLLALLRRLQEDRATMAWAMSETVREHSDIAGVCAVFLRMLGQAQRDVLPECPEHAHLPLRRIDVSGLELISACRRERAVYVAEEDCVLKTVAGPGQLSRACAVFDAMCAAYEASAPVARPRELVRTKDGYAVLLERAVGHTLTGLVAAGSVSPRRAGKMLADAMRQLHDLRPADERLRDVRELLASMVSACAQDLPEPVRQACDRLVAGLGEAGGLVHGDCHPGNLIVGAAGRCVLIDADTICVGDPLADLALARSSLVCEGEADQERQERYFGISTEQAHEIWEGLLDAYFAYSPGVERADVDRITEALGWLAVLDRLNTGDEACATDDERFSLARLACARIARTCGVSAH